MRAVHLLLNKWKMYLLRLLDQGWEMQFQNVNIAKIHHTGDCVLCHISMICDNKHQVQN